MNKLWLAVVAVAGVMMGCTGQVGELDPTTGEEQETAIAYGELSATEAAGAKLFATETFKGNGRTCATCHRLFNGALTPAHVQSAPPSSPLFRKIDADDPTAATPTYNRLKQHATVLVTIPLPTNVVIIGQPNKRSVTIPRGVPTVLDTPALDKVLMADGRAPNLKAQALDAVNSHAQPGRQPTNTELSQIAAFQKTLFSQVGTYKMANGGPALTLPAGNTASEKRGRVFFDGVESACGGCHFGPLRNGDTGVPEESFRFADIAISTVNKLNLPTYEWGLKDPATGEITPLADLTGSPMSPDPGRFLVTGAPEDFNAFKSPAMVNLRNTAPYFHDNSAKNLDEVMDHYDLLFTAVFGAPPFTAQERQDIINFMKLL